MPGHRETVLDQFTRQAAVFAAPPAMRNADALQLLVRAAGASSADTLLDVACGPGLVVCAFAPVVRHATGIDLVPAMIEQARALQAARGLHNVSWRLGDVLPLPFADRAFGIVVSRYAFHHLPDPGAVLREMTRVCAPGGTVLLCDVAASPDPRKAQAFDAMERLRDPSHVRALPLAEMQALFAGAGLEVRSSDFYRLELELEALLQGSFPNPGDADRVKDLFLRSLVDDGLGLDTRREGAAIRCSYPIAVLCGRAPARDEAGRSGR
jgi:SAM-dependent methyltransferase